MKLRAHVFRTLSGGHIRIELACQRCGWSAVIEPRDLFTVRSRHECPCQEPQPQRRLFE